MKAKRSHLCNDPETSMPGRGKSKCGCSEAGPAWLVGERELGRRREEMGRAGSWRAWLAVVRSLGFLSIRMGGCLRDLRGKVTL